MPFELVTDAFGDPRNATALAVASDLTYLAEPEAKLAFREQLNLDARLFTHDNTQAYLLQNDQHVVVAFRGTENPATLDGLKDWLLTNALNLLVLPEGRLGTDFAAAGVGARFHKGFLDALAEIWDPVESSLTAELDRKQRPFWLTGHSLGGALATLAAWLCARRFIDVHQIYTYGAPMIGNSKAMEAFDRELRGKIFRYVDTIDPIPLLPTISLIANQYGHCKEEMKLGASSGALDLFQNFASRAVSGILQGTLVDEFWQAILGRLNAHMMNNYRDKIGKG
jgi:hypothetical protein